MKDRLLIVTFFATVVIWSIFMLADNIYAFQSASTNFNVYQVLSGVGGSSTLPWSTGGSFMEVGDNEPISGSSTGSSFILNSGLLWDIVGIKSSQTASFTFTIDSGTESFPTLNPGTMVSTSSILYISTNNSTGYNVTVARNSSSGTMSNSGTYLTDKTNLGANWLPGDAVCPPVGSYSGDIYIGFNGTISGRNEYEEMTPGGTFMASSSGPVGGGVAYNDLYGFSVSPFNGNVYISNALTGYIQEVTLGNVYVNQWSAPTGGSAFSVPFGIAVSPISGNVYVADTGNTQVVEMTSSGTLVTSWNGSVGGTAFSYPVGIAVSPITGNVYVADASLNLVEEFTSSGTFVTSWNGSVGGTTFSSPHGIAVSPITGNVYVTDYNNKVQEFTSSGTFVTSWNGSVGGTTFSQPSGVAVAPNGNVYVADTANSLVQEFSSSGTFINKWSAPTGGDSFNQPWGIGVVPGGDGTASSTSEQSLQFRVKSSGTTAQAYCSAWWGNDDTSANALFAGFPYTAQKIISSTAPTSGTAQAVVLYSLDVPVSQKTGTYSGSITYTATTGP